MKKWIIVHQLRLWLSHNHPWLAASTSGLLWYLPHVFPSCSTGDLSVFWLPAWDIFLSLHNCHRRLEVRFWCVCSLSPTVWVVYQSRYTVADWLPPVSVCYTHLRGVCGELQHYFRWEDRSFVVVIIWMRNYVLSIKIVVFLLRWLSNNQVSRLKFHWTSHSIMREYIDMFQKTSCYTLTVATTCDVLDQSGPFIFYMYKLYAVIV